MTVRYSIQTCEFVRKSMRRSSSRYINSSQSTSAKRPRRTLRSIRPTPSRAGIRKSPKPLKIRPTRHSLTKQSVSIPSNSTAKAFYSHQRNLNTVQSRYSAMFRQRLPTTSTPTHSQVGRLTARMSSVTRLIMQPTRLRREPIP